MNPRSVRVYAPASISNIGPCFDVLGLAINRPGDFATARRIPEKGVRFTLRSSYAGIPDSARENVAGHVASLMIKVLKPRFGLDLTLEKRMPPGSGLGSSGASSVAAAMAVNCLLPEPLPKEDLLPFVVEGERLASGSPHADNVAPSLLGGLCLVRYDPLNVTQIPVKKSPVWVVVHPHVVVHTRMSRAALPKSVPLHSAVRQWGNVAGVIAGFLTGDFTLLGMSIEDGIVEPVRARFIPGFTDVRRAALSAGAFGCSISGSGPSVFAVAGNLSAGRTIARAMAREFRKHVDGPCDSFVSRMNREGARVIWMKNR